MKAVEYLGGLADHAGLGQVPRLGEGNNPVLYVLRAMEIESDQADATLLVIHLRR